MPDASAKDLFTDKPFSASIFLRYFSGSFSRSLPWHDQKTFGGDKILFQDLMLLQQSIETGLRETRNTARLFDVPLAKRHQVI